MPQLLSDFNQALKEIDKLDSVQSAAISLSIYNQQIVAEIILLRLFDLVVNYMQVLAEKIASGAIYLDNTTPQLSIRACRSRKASISIFETHNRTNRKKGLSRNLAWTTPKNVEDNVMHVIQPTDNYISIIRGYGLFINEMRLVRNRIAHNNKHTRSEYANVIVRYYGAKRNNIPPGMLLLTSRVGPPPLLNQYINRSRNLVRGLAKG